MGTSVYTSLLIKDLRRKRGDLQKLRKQAKAICRELLVKQREVAALETVLRSRGEEASAEVAESIRTTPKTVGLPWNRLTVSVVGCLREAGTPVASNEIARYVAEINSLSNESPSEAVALQTKVKDCLKRLATKGRVVRLHPSKSSTFGTWCLPDR